MMTSEKMKILAIVPYKGLHDQLVDIAVGMTDMIIDTCIGELDDACRIAIEKEKEYDIILSRGGTAEALGKTVKLPIITLRPTVFDLLRVMRMVETYKGKYAFVGFSDITKEIQSLFKITQAEADVYTITDAFQVESCIQALKKDAYSMIVGDVIAVNTARKLHLNGVLITSGEESIHNALNEARQIYSERKRREQNERLQQKIMAQMDECLYVYNAEKELIHQDDNQSGPIPPVIVRKLAGMVDDVLANGSVTFNRSVGGSVYHIRGFRDTYHDKVIVFYIIKQQENVLQNKDSGLIYYHEPEDFTEAYIDNVGKMEDVYSLARKFSKANAPVVILREDGIDDLDIAYSIHRHCNPGKSSMLIIDTKGISKKKFSLLLNSEKSPLCQNNQCILFHHLSSLSQEQANEFCNYAEDAKLHKRNTLIFAFSPEEVKVSPWNRYLASINSLQLPVPPLSQRREDISSLATLYLNSYNMQNGRNAITFDPDAVQLLVDYPWRQNTQQLRRVIQYAALLCNSITISADNVQAALEAENRYIDTNIDTFDLLSGTLDQIIGKVIQAVLAQENRNKTKAAERLGISRSTLWRLNNQSHQETGTNASIHQN